MKKRWTIGSSKLCDIQVESQYVSGSHCRLEHAEGQWFLEDCGSTNGTFVNGAQVSGRVRVSRSDHVTLGRSQPLPWPEEPKEAIQKTRVIALPNATKTIVVGRAADCDVVLNFPMVSARHASLQRDGNQWIVRDLASTNGTFVHGQRISGPVSVAVGEEISLGSYRLRLSSDGKDILEEDSRGTAVLEAHNVAVSVSGQRLISGASIIVKSGEIAGIMGPSGSGKSTLLAALVGCQEPSEGRVAISGVDVYSHSEEFRGQIGYVPQDDIMHTDLTVQQALWYSARLRLPGDFSDDEIRRRITVVIQQLGLGGLENSRIGSADKRGISGGQRKRVNVAMELLTDPPIIVLDEPTSGLSSTDALSLMQLLRTLANTGKVVVLTIHQPSLDAFKLMDSLTVIAKDQSTQNIGLVAWHGRAYPDAIEFFEPGNGATRPTDVEAVLRGLGRRPVTKWVEDYRQSVAFKNLVKHGQPVVNEPIPKHATPSLSLVVGLEQWWTLAKRMVAVKCADSWGSGVLLAQAPIIALFVAGVFAGKTTEAVTAATWPDVAKAVATTGFLLALAAIWFGCSNAAREIVAERAIFRRERMVGLSTSAYVGSKIFVLGLVCLMQCGALLGMVYWACGLEASFILLFRVLFLAALVGVVLGLMVSTLARTAEAAAGILPIVILPMVILGGILLPLKELPTVAAGLADTMPSRWAFEGLLIEEAAVRPLLEVPSTAKPNTIERIDMAEKWFSLDGWRHSSPVPSLVLLLMSLAGILLVYAALTWREARKS